MQVAKYFINETTEDLTPTTGGTPLPGGSTFMLPGVYTLGGQSWDCTRAGLYRFKMENEAFFRNRIVAGSPPDLYAVVSAVCWNHIHGSADDVIGNLQPVSDKGRFFVWRMRCGYIGNFMAWLLPQYGMTVRQVGVSTLGPTNGYDDGHQVLEVFHGGKWKMFDITNGRYWKDANGAHMSTSEFIAAIAGGAPMPECVLLDGKQRRWDHEGVPNGTLDMGLYGELCIGTEAQMEAWIRRIYQKVD